MLKTMTSGFQVFNYWVGLHYTKKGTPVPETLKHNTQAKLKFNSATKSIKDQYGFSSEELKGLILYCYIHNPLNFSDVLSYGNIDSLRKSAPDYAYWMKNNRDLINKLGLNSAIAQSASKKTKTDEMLHELLCQFKTVFE